MAFPAWFDDKFGPHTIELYQDEIRHTPVQLIALQELLGGIGQFPVLDLCCGWGRHALPLAVMGNRVVGLDGSSYFLQRAAGVSRTGMKGSLVLARGDMRCLPFADRTFAAAFQMYTSFGYGTDSRDDDLVLGEVARVLRPEGIYLLDLINWTLARKAFDGKYEETYPNFDVVEDCRIEPKSNLLRVQRALLWRDGRRPHIYGFEIRMFDQAEIACLLERAGFKVTGMWGDFDRSAYVAAKSYRMISVCRREKD